MDVKVGDAFVRHLDEKVWKVRWIDGTWVILESSGNTLVMTDIYGLRSNYDRLEPGTIQ